jgi:hypothetical protein
MQDHGGQETRECDREDREGSENPHAEERDEDGDAEQRLDDREQSAAKGHPLIASRPMVGHPSPAIEVRSEAALPARPCRFLTM